MPYVRGTVLAVRRMMEVRGHVAAWTDATALCDADKDLRVMDPAREMQRGKTRSEENER